MVDDVDRRYDKLVHTLVETAALLREYGVDGWADWLDRDRMRIEDGDGFGVEHLLSAFGGMGSLNDLLIHPINGNPIAAGDIDRVNERLVELRSLIHANATWLWQQHGREPGHGRWRSR